MPRRRHRSTFDLQRIRDPGSVPIRWGWARSEERGDIGPVQLEGQRFIAFNGGPHFPFTPAISLFVSCETQDELDTVWNKLVEGGRPQRCGWLQDRYGLSWQIIPTILGTLLQSEDSETAKRAMSAMLTMERLDIAALRQAAERQ